MSRQSVWWFHFEETRISSLWRCQMNPVRSIARRFPARRFYSARLQTESALRYDSNNFDINEALRSQRTGVGLEQPFYNDPSVYQRDLERVWHRNWLFAGFSTQIRSPGEFFTYQVGDENVIVIRGDDKKIRAFHNVCRHRGSRICTKESGKVLNLTCPYHAWTYSKKGECIKAPQVGDQIDISQKSLVNAQIQEVNGLVFISFSDNPPNFEPARELLAPQLRMHRLEDAKIAFVTNDTVKANWKIIYENNRECYHCATTHPEYIRSNYDLAFSYTWDQGSEKARRVPDPNSPKYQEAIEHTKYCQDLWEEKYGITCTVDNSFPGEGWYRASRAPLKKGWVNESLDGQALGPILGDFKDRDLGTLRIHVLPNFWIHVSSDYACSARLTPIDRFHTNIQTTWLVHQDVNVNEDFLSRLLPFWQKTNDADWRLCEANMAGIMSSRYQPPEFVLSKESGIQNFLWWYTQQIGDKAPNQNV